MRSSVTSLLRLSSLGLLGLAWTAETPAAGVTVTGSAVGEAWANASGGPDRGDWFVAGADVIAEFPASLVRGPEAGSVLAHVRALKHHRRDGAFSDYVGGFHPVSNTFASEQLRVYNLYYRHAAPDAGWQFKVGQLALDDDFAVSTGGAHFINAAFGALPSLTATTLRSDRGGSPAFPIYSVAAPGFWFERRFGDAVTWQTGIYHGGPGGDRRGNHGFRWDSASHAGFVAVTEWVLAHHVGTRTATSKLGFSAHSGSFDELEAAAQGKTDVHVRGLWSAYATHDVALLGPDPEAPRLMAFGRLGVAPQQDRATISFYTDVGLVSHGPLASRPKDIAGVGVSYSRFGRGFRSVNAMPRTETLIEVFYAFAITEQLTVTTDVHWVFNATRDPAIGDRGTAAVLGLRTRFAW